MQEDWKAEIELMFEELKAKEKVDILHGHIVKL